MDMDIEVEAWENYRFFEAVDKADARLGQESPGVCDGDIAIDDYYWTISRRLYNFCGPSFSPMD